MKIKQQICDFWKEEDAIGVVEMILILAILIALVVIFKDKIGKIVTDAFSKITKGSNEILK